MILVVRIFTRQRRSPELFCSASPLNVHRTPLQQSQSRCSLTSGLLCIVFCALPLLVRDCSVKRSCCSLCSLVQYSECHLPPVSPSFRWHVLNLVLTPVSGNSSRSSHKIFNKSSCFCHPHLSYLPDTSCVFFPFPLEISQFLKQINQFPPRTWSVLLSNQWLMKIGSPCGCCFLPLSVDRTSNWCAFLMLVFQQSTICRKYWLYHLRLQYELDSHFSFYVF